MPHSALVLVLVPASVFVMQIDHIELWRAGAGMVRNTKLGPEGPAGRVVGDLDLGPMIL